MITFEYVSFFDVLELEDLTVAICPATITDLGWCYKVNGDRQEIQVWLPRNYTNQPPVLLNSILSDQDWPKVVEVVEQFLNNNATASEVIGEIFATSEPPEFDFAD